MATITSLNQYKASYADSTDMSVAASSLTDAIVALAEAKEGEPSLIQRVVTGIKVAIPAPTIAIKTLVTGTGAEASGCKATPYNISSVENGDKVWFTAIVSPALERHLKINSTSSDNGHPSVNRMLFSSKSDFLIAKEPKRIRYCPIKKSLNTSFSGMTSTA